VTLYSTRESFQDYQLKEKTHETTDAHQDQVSEPVLERPKMVKRSIGMHEEVDPEILTVNESVLNTRVDGAKSFQEAVIGPHSEEWKAAIQSELKSLAENETWKLVERKPEGNVVKCKWVFRVKETPDGTVERY
jgi:hypothetical protein